MPPCDIGCLQTRPTPVHDQPAAPSRCRARLRCLWPACHCKRRKCTSRSQSGVLVDNRRFAVVARKKADAGGPGGRVVRRTSAPASISGLNRAHAHSGAAQPVVRAAFHAFGQLVEQNGADAAAELIGREDIHFDATPFLRPRKAASQAVKFSVLSRALRCGCRSANASRPARLITCSIKALRVLGAAKGEEGAR